VIGSMIIKHMMNLDDREVVDQISENIYMQFFLGYQSFSIEPPFDPSLFVEFRKKLGVDLVNAINEKIISLKTHLETPKKESKLTDSNDADEHTAQKKNKSRKAIRSAVGSQLRFLNRNLKSINKLLNSFSSVSIPLEKRDFKYLLVINFLYQQQKEMYDEHKHTIEDRIISIHQPHVRPIVRGKTTAKVEFGAKIHVSIIDGISFFDEISWDAFNEGSHMVEYVEKYKVRFGCYPRELLADKIYCTRFNRAWLKQKGIRLIAKPLGRPSAVQNHVSPGERNPIEGKFGQAKTVYRLDRINARLRETSESWIACIILVLNLVKLAGAALPCTILKWWNSYFSKRCQYRSKQIRQRNYKPIVTDRRVIESGDGNRKNLKK